jgi:hypothetical protein
MMKNPTVKIGATTTALKKMTNFSGSVNEQSVQINRKILPKV